MVFVMGFGVCFSPPITVASFLSFNMTGYNKAEFSGIDDPNYLKKLLGASLSDDHVLLKRYRCVTGIVLVKKPKPKEKEPWQTKKDS